METEKRLEILKEIESIRKKLSEPSVVHRYPFVTYTMAIFTSIVGIYYIAMVIAKIGKGGVTPLSVIMLLVGFVIIIVQWFFIASHNYNKRLLLIYEALLANNSKESNSAA